MQGLPLPFTPHPVITPLVIGLIIVILVLAGISIFLFLTRQKIVSFREAWTESAQTLQNIAREIDTQKEHLQSIVQKKETIEGWLSDLYQRKAEQETLLSNVKDELRLFENELNEKRRQGDVSLSAEMQKKRDDYERYLEAQFEILKNDSKWQGLLAEMDNLNSAIAIGKKTLEIVEQKVADKVSEEDFREQHTIHFTEDDKEDIEIIRALRSKLHNKDVISKLIWTHYYQKPLQDLRKRLDADSKTGIYKITSIRDGRCYIGQARSIGTRWTEHFKAAIEGTLNARTSKFYRALGTEGPENFTYEVLEECAPANLSERERYWIDFYNAKELGYNSTIGG